MAVSFAFYALETALFNCAGVGVKRSGNRPFQLVTLKLESDDKIEDFVLPISFPLPYFLDKIWNQVVETPSGKALRIAQGFALPYISNGNAGLALALLWIDKDKYSSNIIELLEGIKFEFAQKAGLIDGMLGLAYCLTYSYSVFKFPSYLIYAHRLLLNTSFYIPFNDHLLHDFYNVLALYKKTLQDKEYEKKIISILTFFNTKKQG